MKILAQLLRRLVRIMTLIQTNFIQIHKTAKLIRNDMLHMSTQFSGSFPSDCQETAVPQSLLTLVNMLLYGTELTSDAYSQSALSLSQSIMFNCIKRSTENTKSLYHSYSRETPLPVYLGMMFIVKHENEILLTNCSSLDSPCHMTEF